MGEACERAQLDFCPLGCSGRGECRAAPPAAGALPGVRQSARASLAARAAARLLFYSMDPAQYSTALPPAPPPASPRGVCVCRAASFGAGCEETDDAGAAAGACPSLCSGHGLCREQGCACEAGYGGDDCGVACPDECNGNGRCANPNPNPNPNPSPNPNPNPNPNQATGAAPSRARASASRAGSDPAAPTRRAAPTAVAAAASAYSQRRASS